MPSLIHNCLRSPCSSNYQISNDINSIKKKSKFLDENNKNFNFNFHIYETTNILLNLNNFKNFPSHSVKIAPLLSSNCVEKSAQRYLIIFITLGALIAVSHQILLQTVLIFY